MIDKDTVKRLNDGLFKDPTIPRKLETIVRWVADQSEEVGQKVLLEAHHSYPIATCRSEAEFCTFLDETISMGYLSGNRGQAAVTFKGWTWLTERPNTLSSSAFVAMPFNKRFDPIKDAIAGAIDNAGYAPTRVDEQEYVGGVMDKIIALIRGSRFVVADFTSNRGGVYYEAGFAFGRDIPVIQVCEQSQIESKNPGTCLHFDVDHLNFLGWKDGAIDDFATRLENRILAVIGRGPLSKTGA